jgi:hypothetical protein
MITLSWNPLQKDVDNEQEQEQRTLSSQWEV